MTRLDPLIVVGGVVFGLVMSIATGRPDIVAGVSLLFGLVTLPIHSKRSP